MNASLLVLIAGSFVTVHSSVSCTASGSGCSAPPNLQWYQDTSQAYPIVVTSITATYNGASADSQGGFDVSKNMNIIITANNNYGIVTTPMMDVAVSHCAKSWLHPTCTWSSVTLINAFLKNLDPCDSSLGVSVVPDCHLLAAGQQTITVNVNLSKNPTIYGAIQSVLAGNTYYELTITMRETAAGKARTLAVVTAEDLIKAMN